MTCRSRDDAGRCWRVLLSEAHRRYAYGGHVAADINPISAVVAAYMHMQQATTTHFRALLADPARSAGI